MNTFTAPPGEPSPERDVPLPLSGVWPAEAPVLLEACLLLLLNKASADVELLMQGMAEFGRAVTSRRTAGALGALTRSGLVRPLPAAPERYELTAAGRAELHQCAESLTNLRLVIEEFLSRWRRAG